VPPPSTTTSRPGRLLAALAALLIVLLAGVLGSNIVNPGHWHKSFKVGLGLDLSWGTQITLKAEPPKRGETVDQGAMAKAKQIMLARIDGSGFTGASVVQQGSDLIVVSVPHENATAVSQLVGTTAQLAFRQALLSAPNTVTTAATTPKTTPSAKASTSPSPTVSPSASVSPKASVTPSTSPSSSGKAATGGTGQAVGATALGAKSSPKPTASPSASTSPSASPSPSSSATKTTLATTADGSGSVSALTPQTVADFDKLNCANPKWQTAVYGSNPNGWERLGPKGQQAVSCYKTGGIWYKYALSNAIIQGTDLSAVNAEADTSGAGYVVAFNVKSGAADKLGAATEQMVTKYYPSVNSNADDSILDQLVIVLDGQVQSTPIIQGAISSSGQITGPSGTGFSEGQAGSLANILKYGSLPLSFVNQDTSAVSPQLGSAQLSAGILAGIVGLILVVIYSFIYYRGLAIISVSSLAIAAALTYLTVVYLSVHEDFNMTLAGIAGLIVAIGITADSFIVYFERLRDEVREGRSLRAAVERGWTRARRTILVSDTVSFLAALLLYIFAIGDVRGFAFTLGLTTLVDIVVVFLFTKPMITLLARTKFFGQGHRLSGLDPARLGARAPWRGSRRPPAAPAGSASATPKEA
jgi:preprotein translocase subunit SecD